LGHDKGDVSGEKSSSRVDRMRTPEEIELQQKKAELTVLEAELADKELELETLMVSLDVFEVRYKRIVGVRYAELDGIEAKIAEELARRNPKDAKAKEHAKDARKKAEESTRETRGALEQQDKEKFEPSEDLKKLYWEIAKKVHPDLASDEKDRERRNKFMAEVNNAYRNGDEAKLKSLLREWDSSPESVKGEGVAVDLVRVIRKIHRGRERLKVIAREIEKLMASELHGFMSDVEEAEKEGRDMLGELAGMIGENIAGAKERLRAVRKEKG